jgi:hypothetical protein
MNLMSGSEKTQAAPDNRSGTGDGFFKEEEEEI